MQIKMTKRIFFSILFLFCFTCDLLSQDTSVETIMSKKYNPATNLVVWPAEFNPTKANWYVYNEIEINAKPEIVWAILIDAKKWHTFYSGAESPVEFLDTTQTSLKNGMIFKLHTMGLHLLPEMKEFVPNERMAWEVRRGNLSAYHAWVIVPTAKGCRLITPEAQNGFLTHMQKIFLPNKLLKLHDSWLRLIKERAEDSSPRLSQIERNKMIDLLNNSLQKFNTSINNLSESQLNFRPSKGKWTIAECIEHISLAELEFPRILAQKMSYPAEPKLRTKIKIKDDEIQPKMTSRKWKAKSQEIFKPNHKFSNTIEATAAFRSQRNRVINYVETTNDDLRNRYWNHPLTGKIDLYQTLILMSAHLERHIEQIENIKKTSVFPQN
jgi:hypothetical protein